ncbi:hypothetical protein Fcan01_00721 [Folsomia candida]|uniref:Uncharacterized protein n=1 Tax=Folsomia candida TaxID=158441 RepID=A0A226EXT1_FOLCA|nr:hypothetical protein Fcan01_00721 [Folsomia candida]
MYCTSLCLNLCFGPLTTLQKLQGLVFFIAYLTASIIRWNYSLDNDPIQLIHAFLDFEATIVSGLPHVPRSLGVKAVRWFTQACELGAVILPIFVFLLLRVIPCTPPFVLSMLPGCENAETTFIRYVGRLGIHIFETWMFLHILYSGSTWLLYIFFVGIIFILNFLRRLER